MKKAGIILGIGVVLALGAVGFVLWRHKTVDLKQPESVTVSSTPSVIAPFKVAAGVVPHHLVAQQIITDFYKAAGEENPSTIILVGPDHFNQGVILGAPFITIESKGQWSGLGVNDQLMAQMATSVLVQSDSAVAHDHSIMAHVPFIKELASSSLVVPIIISSTATREEIESLAVTIDQVADDRTIVVASVDFSHYLPLAAADFHDVKSRRVLINNETVSFDGLEVDSWQSLYLARSFAQKRHKESPQIIGQGNSLLLSEATSTDGGTSYFSVLFTSHDETAIATSGLTILATGDIMLDREVEKLMKKNSWSYPFEKVANLFRGVDILWGNLEGPIVPDPKDYAKNSFIFNFDPQNARTLKQVGFSLLTLANNHTLNRGNKGLEQTRTFLKEQNILAVGDPTQCLAEYSATKDSVVFLAFNRTWPNECTNDKIIQQIKLAREANPNIFLAVSFHWGNEYEKVNSKQQQQLAHSAIDGGADVIIGHHPHVVQNIELYQNKLIFYSLGNFIFDQYFSLNTQEGLAVGIEIYPDKQVYRLFPVKGASQPALMCGDNINDFLKRLSINSTAPLAEQIKGGMIELNNNN